jgi:hypothetical protein
MTMFPSEGEIENRGEYDRQKRRETLERKGVLEEGGSFRLHPETLAQQRQHDDYRTEETIMEPLSTKNNNYSQLFDMARSSYPLFVAVCVTHTGQAIFVKYMSYSSGIGPFSVGFHRKNLSTQYALFSPQPSHLRSSPARLLEVWPSLSRLTCHRQWHA